LSISRGRCLLSDWLELKGWSQVEYARRSGRSKRMISHFCGNERAMLPEDLYIASKLFDCGMDKFYEWIEQE
jgi:transcriptional regulator with XRE-family HTH domain